MFQPLLAFASGMVEERSYEAPKNSPVLNKPQDVVKGGSGKPSFARVFGALVLFSSLIGWWLAGFNVWGFELPSQTPMFVFIGLTPYLSSKLIQVLGPFLTKK